MKTFGTLAFVITLVVVGGCRTSKLGSNLENTNTPEASSKAAEVTAVTGTFSGDAALKVHAALDITTKKALAPKTIKTQDGSLECQASSSEEGTATEATCHYIVIEGKINPNKNKKIILNPLTSQEIYNSLDLEAVEHRDLSIKKTGNLKCSLKIAQELTYKCSLTGVKQVAIRSVNHTSL